MHCLQSTSAITPTHSLSQMPMDHLDHWDRCHRQDGFHACSTVRELPAPGSWCLQNAACRSSTRMMSHAQTCHMPWSPPKTGSGGPLPRSSPMGGPGNRRIGSAADQTPCSGPQGRDPCAWVRGMSMQNHTVVTHPG